ncbi:unnamed protein product [Protopolystoma xenopodis]|uniref:Uncharacterized protein n=1 Tax=Protopolystoma xenopodis TaxID=117903 RepID=A0A3S5CRX1_9PLAT|nr:unnamed protein product [Protopolystoma xenopodis]
MADRRTLCNFLLRQLPLVLVAKTRVSKSRPPSIPSISSRCRKIKRLYLESDFRSITSSSPGPHPTFLYQIVSLSHPLVQRPDWLVSSLQISLCSPNNQALHFRRLYILPNMKACKTGYNRGRL